MQNKITYDLIKPFLHGYDPIDIGIPKNYNDTICNFIINYRDKIKTAKGILNILYILCNYNLFLTTQELRLLAVDNAKNAKQFISENELENFDAVLKVVTKYAYGNATTQNLGSAWSVANKFATGFTGDFVSAAAWRCVEKSAVLGSGVNPERDYERCYASTAALDSAKKLADASFFAIINDFVSCDNNSIWVSVCNSTYNKTIDKLLVIFKEKE